MLDPSTPSAAQAVSSELGELAELLQHLGMDGLEQSQDSYHRLRFDTVVQLAASIRSLAASEHLSGIERAAWHDLESSTPLAGAECAIFDELGKLLLIQRADSHTWALPGGGCDVGEAPATTSAREAWEETGYLVEITHLLGVHDGRLCGSPGHHHLYHFVFGAQVTGGEATLSGETLAVQWMAADEIPWDALHPGHEPRIRSALARAAKSATSPFFDWEHDKAVY
jgi:ADP-ribose pyrophosphatase YjhB (NUDIX family)